MSLAKIFCFYICWQQYFVSLLLANMLFLFLQRYIVCFCERKKFFVFYVFGRDILSFINAAIEGWDALHANPTVGSLGKGIWEVIYITQVHTEQFLGQLGPRVGEVFEKKQF